MTLTEDPAGPSARTRREPLTPHDHDGGSVTVTAHC